MDQVVAGAGADVIVNENFRAVAAAALYGLRPAGTSGLTLGYYGGALGDALVADGTVALPASTTVYIVARRDTGVVSASTGTVNWTNATTYLRVGVAITGPATITGWVDWRGAYGGGGGGGGGGFANPMTSAGDLIVGGASGAPQRRGAGANGQVLKIVAGNPVWADESGGGGGGGGAPALEAPFVAPPQDGWSWVNQGASSLSDSVSEQVIVAGPTGAGANMSLRARAAPVGDYILTARIRALVPVKNYLGAGIGLRNSVSGQLIVFDLLSDNAGAFLRCSRFNSATSFGSDYLSVRWPTLTDIWLRIADNGTNRVYFYSADGIYWTQFFSVSRTDFTVPDQLYFGCGTENTGTPNLAPVARLLSWSVETP